MTTPWQVHLSPGATTTLRAVTRSASTRIAAVLDGLAQRGPTGIERDRLDEGWVGHVAAGDYQLTLAGRDDDTRIIVMRIELAERHAALRAADLLPVRIATRRAIGGLLQGLDLDLRYTLRSLRRAPVFAAVVMATLAIALGGTTALVDLVHTVYASALPFGDADRLVRIRNVNTSASGVTRRYNISAGDLALVRAENHSFTEVIGQSGRSLSLLGDGPAERVSAIGVSPNWSRTLRLAPILGRTFTPEEERAGTDAGVALISHALWSSRFGGDPNAVGQPLRYDGGVLTVVGVMPPGIGYPYDAAVWTPWTFPPTGGASSLNVVARLRDDASLESAQADLARVHEGRRAANLQGSATGFDVATSRSDLIRDEGRTVQALAVAVFVLLALACVNVGNLLVARFATRRAELGLRAALGGSSERQLRQLVLEALVLFGGGAIGGVLLANWLRSLLSAIVPDVLSSQLGVAFTGIGAAGVAITLGVGALGGLAVGVGAGLRAMRSDLMSLVRQGGGGAANPGDRRLLDLLVSSQVGLSLVLLVCATLLIARFRDLSTSHPGFELAGVSTFRITAEQGRYADAASRHRLAKAVEEQVAALPGIRAVGITTVNPLCCGDWGSPIEIEGRPVLASDPPLLITHQYVSPGYFGAMTIPVLSGTGFAPSDLPNGPLTVVVDEPFARMAWPGEDPLGKRVRMARRDTAWRTVVGVVPATVHASELTARWFLPYYQDPTGPSGEHLHVMMRQRSPVSEAAIREAIRQIDPGLAVYGATTMESLWSERSFQDRLGAIVTGVFATLGLLLAGFSLYGLMAYSVELRTREIGVRLALGATRRAIVFLVVRQAGFRLLAGLVIGVVLALGANQLLRSAIDGLQWVSAVTLVSLAAILAAVAASAVALPTLRATRVDPIKSLRT